MWYNTTETQTKPSFYTMNGKVYKGYFNKPHFVYLFGIGWKCVKENKITPAKDQEINNL